MSPPRCDFDGVFYRVFCVTLLGTALAFTIILTDVFVDLDALISGKEKEQNGEVKNEVDFDEQLNKMEVESQTAENEDYKQYEEDEVYRTKRSLDSSTFQFHLKSPKMKHILTNRLNTLLEELDTEESTTKKTTEMPKEELQKDENQIVINQDLRTAELQKDEDMLHLTLHDILLKGILGHMDVNEVYGKVHSLIGTFFKGNTNSEPIEDSTEKLVSIERKMAGTISPGLTEMETKFFEELVKCKQLQNQIEDVIKQGLNGTAKPGVTRKTEATRSVANTNDNNTTTVIVKKTKVNPLLIKTIIDITTINDDKEVDISTSNKTHIKGIIKLMYNGEPVEISQFNEETTTISTTTSVIDNITIEPDIIQENNGNILLTESLIGKALREYIKKHKIIRKKHETRDKVNKRLKRNTKFKISGHYEGITRSPKPLIQKKMTNSKKDDDELFVEIETHFDSKGINGERKKKLIKNIVEKIQQAIRSDLDVIKGKKHKPGVPGKTGHILKIRKRFQNPLTAEENKLVNKLILPLDKIINRQMEPIGKSVNVGESLPKVYDKVGEEWSQTHTGPSFLSGAKSINSGEMGGIDLDYNKVMRSNGIPQRLQQPLNGEIVEENNNYFDVGDLKFFVKDVDGTGFSIGFNQFVGEAPDSENLKLFTGLQQMLSDNSEPTTDTALEEVQSYEKVQERDRSHEIVKRSIARANFDDDDHSNEYQSFFDHKSLPYQSYQEIFEDRKKKVTLSVERKILNNSNFPENSFELNDLALPFENHHHHRIPQPRNETKELVIDDKIFERKLNPSQIFILANLLTRKKRSVTVKTFTKKIRPGMSTYINKHTKPGKLYFKNSKRNKRQIDKIRIIATDGLPNVAGSSDENVYLVTSGENILADRATRDEIAESEPMNALEKPLEEKFEYVEPYIYSNTRKSPYSTIFTGKSRHNVLMSKYPHILMEELTKSKEDFDDKQQPMILSKFIPNFDDMYLDNTSPKSTPTIVDAPVGPIVHDLSEALVPHSNYKLTVKIIPKNETDHPGFKEVHTSINKSVNKNGLVFSSQMNISEISKVENYEKEMESLHNMGNHSKTVVPASPLVKHLKEQQEKMKKILKQHTIKIDEQLDHLKKEKLNIESMVVPSLRPDVRDNDGIDVYIPLNPPQMLHLNKIEAGQLISSALMKLHEIPQLNDVDHSSGSHIATETIHTVHTEHTETTESTTTTTTTTTTTEKPTTTSITTTTKVVPTQQYIPPHQYVPQQQYMPQQQYTPQHYTPSHYIPPHIPRVDPDRLRILRTIQRNENLTHAILSKIDRNTDLLQMFLQKLTEKIEPESRHSELKHEEVKTETFVETTTHTPIMNHPKMHGMHYPYPKDWSRQFIDPNYYRNLQIHNLQNAQMQNQLQNMQQLNQPPSNLQNIGNMQPTNQQQTIQSIGNMQLSNQQPTIQNIGNMQIPNQPQTNLQNIANMQPPNMQNMPNIQTMHNIIPNIPLPNLNSNTDEVKNDTDIPIPFVYAYQNPYPLQKPNNQPIASVVYQGHIHPQGMKSIKESNGKELPHTKHLTNKPAEVSNQTRFFIDDLDPVVMNVRTVNGNNTTT